MVRAVESKRNALPTCRGLIIPYFCSSAIMPGVVPLCSANSSPVRATEEPGRLGRGGGASASAVVLVTGRGASERVPRSRGAGFFTGAGSAGDSTVTPLVHVVMGQGLAENLARALAGEEAASVEPSFDDLNRRCELDDGTPIHPRLAALALAGGIFRRIVFDSKSRPVDVAVRSRTFPPWMKQVLLVRARGRCRAPGCDAPFPWLQADHIEPHSRGGPTSLANGQILCDTHNKWKGDDGGHRRDAAA